MIVSRKDWFVCETKTSFSANETSSKSFLGAFLGVNIFDDREMLNQFESVQELNSETRSHIAATLRRRLEGPRAEMFLLIETLLKARFYDYQSLLRTPFYGGKLGILGIIIRNPSNRQHQQKSV